MGNKHSGTFSDWLLHFELRYWPFDMVTDEWIIWMRTIKMHDIKWWIRINTYTNTHKQARDCADGVLSLLVALSWQNHSLVFQWYVNTQKVKKGNVKKVPHYKVIICDKFFPTAASNQTMNRPPYDQSRPQLDATTHLLSDPAEFTLWSQT